MSKGGGSTQSQTSKVEIPKWLEDAAQANIARAKMVADTGYVPNYGLDVAAFSPLQQQGMQATGMGAQAFGFAPQGFDATAGIPTPETVNGFTGYRSGSLFDEALGQLASRRPAQFTHIQDQFINPFTGAASLPTAAEVLADPTSTESDYNALLGSAGSSSDGMPVDTRSAMTKYLEAKDYNRVPQAQLGWGDLLKPGGLVMAGLDAVARPLNDAYMDYYAKNYADTAVEYTPEGFQWTGYVPHATKANQQYFTGGYDNTADVYNSLIASGQTPTSSYSSGSSGGSTTNYASHGGTSTVGTGGGNASRGFSYGGW